MKLIGIVLFLCPIVVCPLTAQEINEVSPSNLTLSSSNLNLIETQPLSNQLPFAYTATQAGNSSKADGKRLYRWSLVAWTAGNAADAVSSWHHPEGNPLLATPGTDFNVHSLAVKLAFGGTSLLLQRWALSHNPGLYRTLARLNFAVAGALAGAAAYNSSLH